ncbi:protein kinase domain-containing protein [Nocardia transvalensis]|uniref:protein kinase domain-containing protein n=1 Tax=Nocardia transvalensis TaxID=37333 RepID=UPI0018950302|nr:protein kinase [Nocardia transvalensis]MBF6333975.1 protein kinase [Nocardia transvalensis]
MNAPPVAAVARFAADWESSLREARLEPPPLARYVPDGSAVRLAVLADLVRVDQRRRWRRRGLGRRMSEYGREFPELLGTAVFGELVCEEYLLRRRFDGTGLAEFCAEYPDQAPQLRRRFGDAVHPGAGAAVRPTLPPQIEIGAGLDDFDLLTALGGTAHAKVFLARQRSMQRLVAVRVEAGADHDLHTVAQLDHQYIVRVFDQRVLQAAGAPLRLQYMQYLPGGTGADLLRLLRSTGTDGGRLLLRSVDTAMEAKGEIRPADSSVRAEIAALSWPETVAWIGRRLASALDYADHQGISHGAVKPSNVLFTAEGVPKLADFGCEPVTSRAVVDPDALPYRAPEQLAGLIDPTAPLPDARADIFALGVLLWEMLTATRPFDDPAPDDPEPVVTLLREHGAGVDARALGTLPPDTPATLRRVLLGCLHPEPERRWRSGFELAAQLDLCLDPRARDLVDPPPTSLRYRARGWLLPIAALCVGVPNLAASVYNIRLNQILIVDHLSTADQGRFQTIALVNNAITFPLAGVLMLLLCRRPLTAALRLARGRRYPLAELPRARAQTLSIGDRLVWVPFAMWLVAGMAWPMALMRSGVALPSRNFVQFYTAQVVCAAIALAYPFFLVTVYVVRSVYPQLLVAGPVGPEDGRQLRRLARRSNFYLAAAASVPLLAVASATFVPADQLMLVLGPVRMLSVGGILAFVLSYWLFRLLEADLRALTRAIPRGGR